MRRRDRVAQPQETNMRFQDKVVIITGAASGIGAATAARFGKEGALLCLADINVEGLAAQAKKADPSGKRSLQTPTDVSVESQVQAMVKAVVDRFGRIDILINNAGTGVFGRVTELPTEDWHRVFRIAVDSVYYASKAAIPHIIKTKGSVVNLGSVSGLYGDYGFAGYNAAKGAVVNLTRTMALDFASDGIRVNAVCPGLVATPLSAGLRDNPKVWEEYQKGIPVARAAEPEEIAAAIAFLASDDASYMTGSCMVVDGGLTASAGQPNFLKLLSAGWG
jgi:meso-butanediol dehydrogenase/(S,S)-butanediol dehydrogenase/diacetyl reductase